MPLHHPRHIGHYLCPNSFPLALLPHPALLAQGGLFLPELITISLRAGVPLLARLPSPLRKGSSSFVTRWFERHYPPNAPTMLNEMDVSIVEPQPTFLLRALSCAAHGPRLGCHALNGVSTLQKRRCTIGMLAITLGFAVVPPRRLLSSCWSPSLTVCVGSSAASPASASQQTTHVGIFWP